MNRIRLSLIAATCLALASSASAQFTAATPKDVPLGTPNTLSVKNAEGLRNLLDGLVIVPDQNGANASFADGVSNATTTYTSATAAFVAGDAGKGITGTNIPSGTTIASVTNGTTVILSQAATGSGTGLAFVIVGRAGNITSIDTLKGRSFGVVLKGNRVITPTNHSPGDWFFLAVAQDGTGTRVPTWDAAVHWPGGTAPTLTTTANKIDMFRFFDTGTSYLGSTVGLNYTP